jgi:hypothetical protein
LPLACEDSSSSSGGTFNPEAGPGFEAGVTPPVEAGVPVDAGGDTSVPTPQGVTVTVTVAGVPKDQVRVLFHDATGAVTGDAKTDATGKVSVAVAPSMVTVLASAPENINNIAPITYLGVAAGDNLLVAAPAPYMSGSNAGSFSVPLTAGTFTAGANTFVASMGNGCVANANTLALPLSISVGQLCGNPGAQNAILATAYDNDGEGTITLLGFGFAKNQQRPVGGATVNVPAITFAAPGFTKLTATNRPAGPSIYARLYAIANNTAFETNTTTGSLQGGDLTYTTATGFADAYQSYVIAEDGSGAAIVSQGILRREAVPAAVAGVGTLTNFDLGTALPLITGATLARPAPARPDITLTTASSLAAVADGGVVSVGINRNSGTLSNATWTFVVPPSTTTFKVPAIPADAAASFAINADDDVFIRDTFFVEATQVPGYKELKTLPVTPEVGFPVLDEYAPLPAAGTVRSTRRRINDG